VQMHEPRQPILLLPFVWAISQIFFTGNIWPVILMNMTYHQQFCFSE
jgi:hypothetical protein